MEEINILPPWSTSTNDDTLRNIPCLPIPLIQSQTTTVVFDNGVLEPEKWLTGTKLPTETNQLPVDNAPDNHLLDKLSSIRSSHLFGGVVIGATPYTPGQWLFSETEWNSLEKACCLRNREGKSCVVSMEDGKDNSDMPLCPLKGEQSLLPISVVNYFLSTM